MFPIPLPNLYHVEVNIHGMQGLLSILQVMFFQWPEEPFLHTWQQLEESQITLCHICDYIYYGHLESLEYLGGAQTPVIHQGNY
jgi:hypothetical protein